RGGAGVWSAVSPRAAGLSRDCAWATLRSGQSPRMRPAALSGLRVALRAGGGRAGCVARVSAPGAPRSLRNRGVGRGLASRYGRLIALVPVLAPDGASGLVR